MTTPTEDAHDDFGTGASVMMQEQRRQYQARYQQQHWYANQYTQRLQQQHIHQMQHQQRMLQHQHQQKQQGATQQQSYEVGKDIASADDAAAATDWVLSQIGVGVSTREWPFCFFLSLAIVHYLVRRTRIPST